MITLEHTWPPDLRPENATTRQILTLTTPQAQGLERSTFALRQRLGHSYRDAAHFVVDILWRPDATWAARFLHSRGFYAEHMEEILEDHIVGREARASEGLTAAGHQMYRQALQLTMARHRFPIDIGEIIAGAFRSGSTIVNAMVASQSTDVNALSNELVNGLLITRSRN